MKAMTHPFPGTAEKLSTVFEYCGTYFASLYCLSLRHPQKFGNLLLAPYSYKTEASSSSDNIVLEMLIDLKA